MLSGFFSWISWLLLNENQRLLLAAREGRVDLVRILLTRGANPSVRLVHNKDGIRMSCTPLGEAATGGHIEVVKTLLAAGASPNTEPNGCTPLGGAASGGHIEVVKTLLAAGADPNAEFGGGWLGRTALMLAASNGHVEVVNALLDAGADPNVTCYLRLGRAFAALGFDPKAIGSKLELTTLTMLVIDRRARVVEAFLERGVDPNVAGTLRTRDGEVRQVRPISFAKGAIADMLRRAGACEPG